MSRGGVLRRRPLYPLLAAAALVLVAWGLWPRAQPVETARVVRAPLRVGFVEEGRTRLRERYIVSAPLDAIVERIAREPGDAVAAGDPLAVLRPVRAAMLDPANRAQTKARLRAAESELAAARATQVSARAEDERSAAALERGTALARDRLIAQSDLDTLRSQASSAASALRAAQARVRTFTVLRDGTRAVLDLQGANDPDARTLVLRAPVEGRVIRRHVESESPVRIGQALMEVGDVRSLDVVSDVLTEDAVRLRPGDRVLLSRWGGPVPLAGRVRTIEPGGFTKVSALGVEEQRAQVVVALEDARRAPNLGDGYRVEAEFIVWQGDAVLQVPLAALFRDGSAWAAYVVEGGRARLRRLAVGRIGETAAEVRSGLGAGATVVLYPSDRLRDGLRVASAGE